MEAPKWIARHFPDLVSAEAMGSQLERGGPDLWCFLLCKVSRNLGIPGAGYSHELGPLALDQTHIGGEGCFWMESKCKQTTHCEIVAEEVLYSELFSVTCVWLVDTANVVGRHKGMSAWADGSGFQKSASGRSRRDLPFWRPDKLLVPPP